MHDAREEEIEPRPEPSKQDIGLNIMAIAIQARTNWDTERIVMQANDALELTHLMFCVRWGLC